ncbi:MAG: NusG domain II-containing protein [Ruminococcus sp.]|jgi:hypothetical protein|nr:NusG domain II-containing protein [Ruminococcus sp.]
MTDRNRIKKNEIIILSAVFAAALIFFALFYIFSPTPVSAQITYLGENYVIPLSMDKTFELRELTVDKNTPNMVFEIKNGGIAVIKSDCPDGDCVKSGFITHTGSAAVCVPNKVTVTLSGSEKTFDAVV